MAATHYSPGHLLHIGARRPCDQDCSSSSGNVCFAWKLFNFLFLTDLRLELLEERQV
jgi:hypothetical protein